MIASKPAVPYAQRVPDPDVELQVFASGSWHGVSTDVALTLAKSRTMRCEDCDGAVRMHRESDIARAHAEHLERHDGCPRSDEWRKGPKVRSRHPHPLS
ncbi:MAG: hypothetical protein DI537_37940 [Stutzerimonas stutzeri]|nr:MAG: hypothetical protein DI537_37940 [Stutzerimonas stutzeri]